jgi:hypothetical protein
LYRDMSDYYKQSFLQPCHQRCIKSEDYEHTSRASLWFTEARSEY